VVEWSRFWCGSFSSS